MNEMTYKMARELPVGTKVRAKIQGKPATKKYRPFQSWGIQSDDIGGEYVDVPAVPDVWIEGVIILHLHPKEKKPFKFVQWTKTNGKVCKMLLKKFSEIEIHTF